MPRRSLFAVAFVLGSASAADAHFLLNAPASATQQDEFGTPQKSAPCGLSDTAGVPDESVPTNAITTVRTGSVLTVSIRETIYHPGHFRVALAQDRAGLPADPAVSPGSTSPCGSTMINPAPTLPLLADGQLVHTSALGNRDVTFDVQLPPGMTCTNCVLQVTQFMSNHALNNPGGCFYHHCATITIADDAPAPDAGTDPGPDGDDSGGCCSSSRTAPTSAALAALTLFLVAARRRKLT
jgi:MYXO-CTERM domain-containing protein